MLKKACIFVMVMMCVIGAAGCAWGGVSLSAFPDPVFREYLKGYDGGWTEYDSNGKLYTVGENDGILGDKEIERITLLYINGEGIKSLEGIGYLTALTSLSCYVNQLTALDVSNNTALTSLSCSVNQLTALNVSNNTALTSLSCNGNYLTALDVSNNTALTDLWCEGMKLMSLDVSNNIALTGLWCTYNQLTELNLSNNIALTDLWCGYNQLTELDLSQNTALSIVSCVRQKRNGLKVKKNSEGYYEVSMKDYVSHPENIDADSISPQPISYNKETGIITFSEPITELRYNYITHSPNNDLMDVTITNPLSIAALERSNSETYGIICDMTKNSYLDSSGSQLTESNISGYSYSDYGKLGLAADGNSRLILRVQTNKPGTVSFSGYGQIGAKLESLSRAEIHPSELRVLLKISDSLYQNSAVLVAPENFPKNKHFPSDSFKIHVKFMDYDGEITEDDLELKIEAAPVMLIHGLWGSAEKTFGGENGPGIWHQLKENGFNVGVCDYNGAKGPSEIIAGDYNRLYLRLWDMFDKYSEKGIVCTKADIVAFGMGGLIAEKYLSEERKDSNDGNNWSKCSYKRGMVRRLITVATPHYGTRWADLITSAPGKILSTADTATKITSPLNFPLRLLINALMTGNKALMDSQSGLRELRTDTARDYVFSSGVPMYAIYGDVSNLIDEDKIFEDTFKDLVFQSVSIGGISVATAAANVVVPVAVFAVISIPALATVAPAVITFAPVIATAVAGAALAYEAKGALELLVAEAVKVFNIAMFNDDGHDLAVSINSAAGGFGSACSGYEGWQYRHWSLPKRDDVGKRVVSLLRGSSNNFKTFGANEKGVMLAANKSAQASANNDSTESLKFIEALNLKVTADESNNVKFTVIAEMSTSYDVYCAVCGGEWVKLFKVPYAGRTGRKFEARIPLASGDIGSVNAFCFSHNPSDNTGTSLLISNVAQVSANSQDDENTPPEITSETLSNAIMSQPYSYQLSASGTPPITWTHTGRLPAGLTLSESGLISGTPTKAGKSTFTAKATNDYGHDSQKFTLQVYEPVSISTASLKNATEGKNYSAAFKAKGTRQITWSAEGLPNGLTINAKTGRISGKPTTYGTYNAKITATNGAGSLTKNFELTVKGIPPKIAGNLARAELNENYSSGLRLTAGSSPVVWSIEGALPEGLSFDAGTGIIYGIPSEAGRFRLMITASNDGGMTKPRTVTLNVKGTPPRITTAKLSDAEAGKTYSATLTATGSQPITWTAENLPDELYLDGDTIKGIPSENGRARITVYASNPVRTVKKILTLKINLADITLPEIANNDNEAENVSGHAQTSLPGHESMTGNGALSLSNDYVIVAVLSAVSCDESGMYDFSVALSDDAAIGAELVYVANSDMPSDDDSIAEFCDDTGAEISCVPESRKITVSIWLNAGTTYRPSIAVRR